MSKPASIVVPACGKIIELRTLDRFMWATLQGWGTLTGLKGLKDVIQSPVGEADPKTQAEALAKRLQEEEEDLKIIKFADEQAGKDYPYLFALVSVRLWAMAEAAAREVIVEAVKKPSGPPDRSKLVKLKGPIGQLLGALIHLDTNGTIFLVATPRGAAAPAQRRAQLRAIDSPLGVDIARGLIAAKIEGQLGVLRHIEGSGEAQEYVAACGERARRAKTLAEVRQIEPLAARAYWRAWQRVPVRFDVQDAKRRPRHWRHFGSRISPLTNPSPRKAVNPANAVLNYLYAILEAEARIAALAVGLDPGLGLLHADRPNRDSLACDLMEPVRPAVDRYVFELLGHRTFTKEDVFELLDGQCRLLPPLTHDLAATASEWARLVRPIAVEVADRIGGARRKRRLLGTASSEFGVRSRRRPRGPTGVTREFGDADEGAVDHPVSPMARRMRALRAANREWERLNGRPDPADFKRKILPSVARMTLRQMHAATGLSRALCTKIRRGDVVPHPRYWEALIHQPPSASHV